jgi:hypothetical protein
MDCKAARLLLLFSHPRLAELEMPESEAVESHLADCPDCGALARSERQFDHAVGLAMRDVSVPGDLPGRLLERLDRERWRWYWRLPRVYPRSAAAAAAALLLACGLLAYWQPWALIPIDTELTAYDFNAQPQQAPEDVEKHFAGLGYKIIAPRDFNYEFLTKCSIEVFQGKKVPVLLFARDQQLAFVYVLSARQFDLDALAEQPRGVGSGVFRVDYRFPDQAERRFAYLIRFTAESLERFLLENRGPGRQANLRVALDIHSLTR